MIMMMLNECFSCVFYLNRGRDAGRRGEVEWQLLEAGIEARRFPAVDAGQVRNLREYPDEKTRARVVTQKLAIRKARRLGAETVLLLEDDVRFHPNLPALLAKVKGKLPEDWKVLFLGCEHLERPEVVAQGLVRVSKTRGTHAVAIRGESFREVLQALLEGETLGSWAEGLQTEAYAALPNLVWQGVKETDYEGRANCRYTEAGSGKEGLELEREVLREMVTGKREEREPKLGLLFLTRDDVNHPELWREWVAQAPERVAVFAHAKNELPADSFLAGKEVSEHFETAWGEVGLVKATRALLREALADESVTHFMLLSEACLPIRPLGEILRRLQWNSRPQMRPRAFGKAPKHFAGRMAKAKDIPLACSRLTSQWWLLDRTAATIVMEEDYSDQFAEVFASDEAYFGTVLKMSGYPLEDFILAEEVTWTHWPKGAGSPQPHEVIEKKFLAEMVSSAALFARKFPAESDFPGCGLHLGPEKSR